jgi:hypothetical protein
MRNPASLPCACQASLCVGGVGWGGLVPCSCAAVPPFWSSIAASCPLPVATYFEGFGCLCMFPGFKAPKQLQLGCLLLDPQQLSSALKGFRAHTGMRVAG